MHLWRLFGGAIYHQVPGSESRGKVKGAPLPHCPVLKFTPTSTHNSMENRGPTMFRMRGAQPGY